MSRIVLALIWMWVVSSCSKTEELKSTLHRTTINTTYKDIVQIIETDTGVDTINSNGKDSVSISFYEYTTVKRDRWSIGEYGTPLVSIFNEKMYCLSDTTKFEYSVGYTFRYNEDVFGETEEEKLYGRYLFFELGEQSTDSNPIIEVKFTFCDSISQIMQKDYSMLEKFPEYYSK